MKLSPSKIGFCLFFIFKTSWLFALQDTLFLNASGVVTSKKEAITYRVISLYEEALFEIRDYDLHHRIKKISHSRGPEASLLQGPATEYDSLGHKVCDGLYHNGFKTGIWNYYYSFSDQVRAQHRYISTEEYEVSQYDSLSGKITATGSMDKYGRRTGTWRQYHFNSAKIKIESNYLQGKKEGLQTEYHPNGVLKRNEMFAKGQLVSGKQFDSVGKAIGYYPAFVYPKYRESVSAFIRSAVPCVNDLLPQNEITIRIQISKEGLVSDVVISALADSACAGAIKQALLQMKKWKPALWENIPVKHAAEITLRAYAPRE